MFYPILKKVFGAKKVNNWYEKSYGVVLRRMGKSNLRFLRIYRHKLNLPLRVVVDTNLSQLSTNERLGWYSTGPTKWGDVEVDTGFSAPFTPNFPKQMAEQIPYFISLCELARNNELTFLRTNTIEAERWAKPDKHVPDMMCTPIDFEIKYEMAGIVCPNLAFTTRANELTEDPVECEMKLHKYAPLFEMLQGKAHKDDAKHLMISDAVGADIFLTADFKFVDRFNQVSGKFGPNLKIRTKVHTPESLCKLLRISKTQPKIIGHMAAEFAKQQREKNQT